MAQTKEEGPRGGKIVPREAAARLVASSRCSPLEAARLFGYTHVMTTKEKAVQAVQALPDDASWEDAMERLFLLAKIERGLRQADAGELIPHEKVKERMAKWLR
jgi:predicted transcriptional regulator